jgi:hypothetical protein
MMHDDSKSILDDVLGRWHRWAKGYSPLPGTGADPLFRNARSSRQWDSSDDVLDATIEAKIMESVEFQVSEMVDPHRTAIHINARNCHSGVSVWNSPRLPKDPLECGVIVLEARNLLTRRLIKAGVI